MASQYRGERSIYTADHYKNKLLLLERTLIVNALRRTSGSAKEAHKLLCPNDKPYKLSSINTVFRRHSVVSEHFRA